MSQPGSTAQVPIRSRGGGGRPFTSCLPPLRGSGLPTPYALYLKGGLLLGLVHNSPRMTRDVDMTAGFRPSRDIDERIKEQLDKALPAAAAALGYAGTRTRVHAVGKQPRGHDIEEARFPSLTITIEHLSRTGGRPCTDRIRMDISFNEPDVVTVDIFDIGEGVELHAYGLVDVIAEKYRALLQQPLRRRERRQDVHDIAFLLDRFSFDDDEKADILAATLERCRARDIEPEVGSIDNPEVERRARSQWDTIALETGALQEFGRCFEAVRRFYRELPWERQRPARSDRALRRRAASAS